jgi:uncharacterized membrane protein SirB2
MAPSILFSWVMLSIIVGVAAGTRGHNAAWFLLALIISPLLAALCLIALRHRRSRSRPSNAKLEHFPLILIHNLRVARN